MPPDFKTENDIYSDMVAGLQTEIPEITNYSPGSIARALVSIISAPIRMLYVAMQVLYFNMFPQDADRETLKRYYDEWGLTWDNPTTDVARATILNKYQENSVIGTKGWYEETVKRAFPQVSKATLYPNRRGPGTADLVVSHNNDSLLDSDIADIQAFFDLDANKVIGMDLLVTNNGVASVPVES